MKKLMLTISLLAVSIGITNATPPATLPMLTSAAAMRGQTFAQAKTVSASYGSMLFLGSQAYGFAAVNEPTEEGVNAALAGMRLVISDPNPPDTIYAWVGVFNTNGTTLFTGQQQFKLQPNGKTYALPPGVGKITLKIAAYVPLDIPGTVYAEAIGLASDGTSLNETSLNINDYGEIMVDPNLAGKNYIFSAQIVDPTVPGNNQTPNGTTYYWRVDDGAIINTVVLNAPIQVNIDGILPTVTDKNVFAEVPVTNSVGVNPVGVLKCTKNETLQVSFWTGETTAPVNPLFPGTPTGYIFAGAWILNVDKGEWQLHTELNEQTFSQLRISFDPGLYYIIPIWNDGDLIEPALPLLPPVPTDGGKA